MKKYGLLQQYQSYLKMVGLDENKMSPIQAIEMKRCFMGACGQIILLIESNMNDCNEEPAVEVLENMKIQVARFFINESTNGNDVIEN